MAAARAHADEGLEKKLWDMADALRGSMDASEYKNVVLGLIFLKYVSDAFEAGREQLDAAIKHPDSDLYFDEYEQGVEVVLEDRDRYAEANVFWVPPAARWDVIQSKAKQPDIGELIDDAMLAIEHDNDRLKGVLPVGYANPTLDKRRLGEVVDLISGIGFHDIVADRDILGRVYEYFLLKFDIGSSVGSRRRSISGWRAGSSRSSHVSVTIYRTPPPSWRGPLWSRRRSRAPSS